MKQLKSFFPGNFSNENYYLYSISFSKRKGKINNTVIKKKENASKIAEINYLRTSSPQASISEREDFHQLSLGLLAKPFVVHFSLTQNSLCYCYPFLKKALQLNNY